MREDHPDQGGDSRKAQLINEAYEVLRDPAKRRRYDEENSFCWERIAGQ
jgi:curved DNA-binding protein CbpA